MSTELNLSPEIGTAAGGKKARLMQDLKAVAADTEGLLKEVAHSSVEELSTARAKIEAKLGTAKARLDEAGGVAAEKARVAADAADRYVRKNPWEVVGVAAAVGLLAGFLAGRR